MSTIRIKVRGRDLKPHKAAVSPLFTARSVLTKEPWTFVSLFLKREKKEEALFYWEQAFTFYNASKGLPLESAPLLLYYSFLNAAKALLTSKNVTFDPFHGVKEWQTGNVSRDALKKVGIEVKPVGVLPSLSVYFGETETHTRHSLQDLLFNMPFIHRTYCLTYKSQVEMFLPLKDSAYMFDSDTNQAYLSAKVSRDFLSRRIVRRLPHSLVAAGPDVIRSRASVDFIKPRNPTEADLRNLSELHHQLRIDICYINGVETLWYAKLLTNGPRRLNRQTPTLVLGAMHRLSELCRYHPMEFRSYLDGQANWLLSEFIQMSPSEYIDQIASDLTGHQFLLPNVRPAS